ncbi:hypothetical protein NUU61_002155 [Penicillium alfredii]|uniref:Inositol polyphosphate-related phosphatase domain-containing protein n=1 Tax=Penicillium alfredii TaxID=1506179 RepID=A0A9W9FR63_9EURO|nr:uncharacterized protein NUU61_002155 [Penicillium alfredii]KAJ5104808.1 hypothetical protein NUU61_002155 [Penicillium alfredii]
MANLNIYILTFNCARNLIDIGLFAQHCFDVLPTAGSFQAPELIVLSLQEIAPVSYSFLGGTYLVPYFDAFCQAVSQAAAKQWDEHYVNLVQENTGMTGLMVFARADIRDRIAGIDTAHVGFGIHEMGNKGAVGARLGYIVDTQSSQTTDLTFVAAHLAPMEDGYKQRNLDWQSIVERLVFSEHQDPKRTGLGQRAEPDADEHTSLLTDPASSPAAKSPCRDLFAPDGYLFLAGDLNYRTSNTGPLKEDVGRFPRHDAHPDSPSHYSRLLKEDQLMREMRQGKSFHGLSEAPINFPPTYKYSNTAREAARLGLDTQGEEWKWSSHRWPSWCDRILYLDTPSSTADSSRGRVTPHVYNALPLLPLSDHRAVALAVSVSLKPRGDGGTGEGESGDTHHMSTKAQAVAPFSIDPHWRQRRDVARRKEVVVGLVAYLGMTWEGNGLLLASTIGVVGAWFVLRSLLEV